MRVSFSPVPETGAGKDSPNAGEEHSPADLFRKTSPGGDTETSPAFHEAGAAALAVPRPADGISRRQALGELGALRKELAIGKGDSFDAALLKLSSYARQQDDPIVQKAARAIIGEAPSSLTVEDRRALIYDPLEMTTDYLENLAAAAGNPMSLRHFSESDRITESLKTLARETSGKPLPGETVRVVTHLGSIFSWRAGSKYFEGSRDQEPQERDRAWAVGCAALVDFWWNNGQVQVMKDGIPVKPGGLDLKQALIKGKAAVRGKTLELESPAEYPLKEKRLACEVMKSIDPYSDRRNDRELKTLAGLYQDSPALASEVIAVIVDTARKGIGARPDEPDRPDWNVEYISCLLSHAKEQPWLRELLQPLLPVLKDLPAMAHRFGNITTDRFGGGDYVNYMRRLAEAFPDLPDASFIGDSLAPLLLAGEPLKTEKAARLAQELWKTHPDLVTPTVKHLLGAPGEQAFDEHQWGLLETAAQDYGWMPGMPELEKLAARIYQPPASQSPSLFGGSGLRNSDFGEGIKFLSILSEKSGTALQGIELPGADGEPVPMQKAMVERILLDRGAHDDILRALNTKGGMDFDRQKRVAALYRLISADEPMVSDLLGSLRGEMTKAGSIDGMPLGEQRLLVMLLSMELKEPQQSKLGDILFPARLQRQYNNIFSSALDRVRRQEIEKGLKEIAGGIPDTAAFFDRNRELLCTEYCTWFSPETKGAPETLLSALEERVQADPGEAKILVSRCLKEFQESFGEHRRLSEMPEKDLVLLQMMEHLSHGDSVLRERLLEILRPGFTVDQGQCKGLENLLDPFRESEMDKNTQKLSGCALLPKERVEIVEANSAIAASSKAFDGAEVRSRTLSAFCDGISHLCAPAPIAGMPGYFSLPESTYRVYSELENADDNDKASREWLKLRDILDRAGGSGQLELALRIYHYTEEMARAGTDREKAIVHALRCEILGADPRKSPMSEDVTTPAEGNVEITDDYIDFGDLKLEIKNG